MPLVAEEGEFKFTVRTRGEHPPPHVHVKCSDGSEVRINLNDGSFMDPAPKGKARAIKQAYRKHAVKIREAWDKYHASEQDVT